MIIHYWKIILFIDIFVATVGFAQKAKTNGWANNNQVLHIQADGKIIENIETNISGWHFNTRLLDLATQDDTNDIQSTLAHDVKRFYQLLHEKKWGKHTNCEQKPFARIFWNLIISLKR